MDADDISFAAKLESWRLDRERAVAAEAALVPPKKRRLLTPKPWPKSRRTRKPKPPPKPSPSWLARLDEPAQSTLTPDVKPATVADEHVRMRQAVREELRRQQTEQTAATGVTITASAAARRSSLRAAEEAHADAIATSAHALAQLARTYTSAALDTLYEVMQDAETPPAARVSAAVALLDRGHGKPAQSVQVSGPNGDAPIVRVVHQYVARGGEVIEGAVVWAGASDATSCRQHGGGL